MQSDDRVSDPASTLRWYRFSPFQPLAPRSGSRQLCLSLPIQLLRPKFGWHPSFEFSGTEV